MALINTAQLQSMSHGFSKIFTNQLKEHKGDFEKVATVVVANSATVDYAWLGDFPKMNEWVGDRQLKDLAAYTYRITKKKFESTIEVDRDDIECDNLGVVKPRIQQMAIEAAAHYDELLFTLLEANDDAYDGKKFFAADHKIANQNFSNIGTKALSSAELLKARAEMRGLVSDQGRPLRIVPNLLVVPPELEGVAINILKKDFLAGGESNVTKGIVDLLVCDFLTDPKAWYLMDTTKPLKPLILQKYREIKLVSMDKEDDENVFMRDKFRYGVSAQHNAGYGLWQLAYKSTGME